MRRALLLSLLLLISLPGVADIYKYTDASGGVVFTDAPIEKKGYRLQWKREAKKVADSQTRLIASGRQAVAPVAQKGTRHLAGRRHYSRLVDEMATRFGLRPELLHAVIRAESAYNASAVSPAGAVGLMQLMPATAERYGVSDIWDPTQNVRGGAQYLRDLLEMFEQDLRLALAAYNAGENAVIRHGKRIPPYPETQRYVRTVLQYLWAERS